MFLIFGQSEIKVEQVTPKAFGVVTLEAFPTSSRFHAQCPLGRTHSAFQPFFRDMDSETLASISRGTPFLAPVPLVDDGLQNKLGHSSRSRAVILF